MNRIHAFEKCLKMASLTELAILFIRSLIFGGHVF